MDFRISREFGTNKYMVELWDGGRIVATIRSVEYGVSVSSRNPIDVNTNNQRTEVYLKFELPVTG